LLNIHLVTSISIEVILLLDSSLHGYVIHLFYHLSFMITYPGSIVFGDGGRFFRCIFIRHLSLLVLHCLNLLNFLLQRVLVFIVVTKFVSDQRRSPAREENSLHANRVSKLIRFYRVGLFKFTCFTFFKIGLLGFYIYY
jgi:hypothetical protein